MMKLTWLELFAGCGGVGTGLQLAGHEIATAIEIDPVIASCYKDNHPGVSIVPSDIRDFNVSTLDDGINAVWCSPVCKQDSLARNRQLAPREDASIGKAVIPYITYLKPHLFILENVIGYRHNPAFHAIVETLIKLRYNIEIRVLDAANYGIPQHRERLILQARYGPVAWPDFAERHTRYDALSDRFDSMEPSVLANWQHRLWKAEYDTRVPLLIAGHYEFREKRGDPKLLCITIGNKPSPCVTSSHNSTDRRIVLASKRILKISPRENARLQSFPDDFVLPKNTKLASEVIGNAVPPLLVQRLMESYQ